MLSRSPRFAHPHRQRHGEAERDHEDGCGTGHRHLMRSQRSRPERANEERDHDKGAHFGE
jgi:hypothetical protein